MGDLMNVPRRDSALTRGAKQAGAGALIVVIIVLAASFLIHAVITLVTIAAVIIAVGAIIWAAFLRKR